MTNEKLCKYVYDRIMDVKEGDTFGFREFNEFMSELALLLQKNELS